MVVVLIIGILAAVAVPQYNKAVMKSRIAEHAVNLKALAEAEEVCYLSKGSACSLDELDIEIPQCNPIPPATRCSYSIMRGGSSMGTLADGLAYALSTPRAIFNTLTVTTPGLYCSCIELPRQGSSCDKTCKRKGFTKQSVNSGMYFLYTQP